MDYFRNWLGMLIKVGHANFSIVRLARRHFSTLLLSVHTVIPWGKSINYLWQVSIYVHAWLSCKIIYMCKGLLLQNKNFIHNLSNISFRFQIHHLPRALIDCTKLWTAITGCKACLHVCSPLLLMHRQGHCHTIALCEIKWRSLCSLRTYFVSYNWY